MGVLGELHPSNAGPALRSSDVYRASTGTKIIKKGRKKGKLGQTGKTRACLQPPDGQTRLVLQPTAPQTVTRSEADRPGRSPLAASGHGAQTPEAGGSASLRGASGAPGTFPETVRSPRRRGSCKSGVTGRGLGRTRSWRWAAAVGRACYLPTISRSRYTGMLGLALLS